MKHAIIGSGNLGHDLFGEIERGPDEATMFTRSTGFDVASPDFPAMVEQLREFDVIWYCVGFGSVPEAKAKPNYAKLIHVDVPVYLAKTCDPNTKLVFFSSDYAADENNPRRADRINPTPRSHYAYLKTTLEVCLSKMNRPNTTCVRVGSLYGDHFPERTFPGKILSNFAHGDDIIQLPENLVTPTPTGWVASVLVDNIDTLTEKQYHHLAPSGNISVRDWAIICLEGFRDKTTFSSKRTFDEERPYLSDLGNTLGVAVHWYSLFKIYFQPARFLASRRGDSYTSPLAASENQALS